MGKIKTLLLNEALEEWENEVLQTDVVRVAFGVLVADPEDLDFVSAFAKLFSEP
jgi:hypothetical protein